MEFSFTKEQEQFCLEVRQFLEDELKSGTSRERATIIWKNRHRSFPASWRLEAGWG